MTLQRWQILLITLIGLAMIVILVAVYIFQQGAVAQVVSQVTNGDDSNGWNWVIFLNTFTVISLVLHASYTYRR
jgi:uncharacterized membrane protein HdeD (DUF308 family)